MLVRTADTTYESLREQFSWDLPRHLNLGVACSDARASAALALVEVAGRSVREHTFGHLTELSNRLANGLRALGVGRGDRVAIMLPQGLHAGVAHLATFKLGAVSVPLTQLFGPDAVAFRAGDSGAKVIITDATTSELVVAVADQLDDVAVVLVDGAAGTAPAPHHGWEDLVARGSARFDAVDTGPDDPAVLIYTSGTTGSPKGALHGHRVLYGHLPGYELMYDFFPREGDRVWTPADWAWIGGLLDALLPAWFHGRPMVAAPRGKFDPEWAVQMMADHRVTSAFLPPTVLKMMRAAGVQGEGMSLRAVMSGGEPLGAEMLAWAGEHLGAGVNEIYGQTEANLLVGNCSSAWPVRPGSMGRPYPGHDLAVLAADGTLAATGTPGEIISRAPDPVHMLRYWQAPEATAAKYIDVTGADGATTSWLRTGDVGHVDDDGYFWFSARQDDVITSAGYRIGPGEIEECLIAHPAVAMAAVIGVPDDTRGHVVKAFVQLADGQHADDAVRRALQEHVRVRLAQYEYPRQIEFVDELPLTTTGKIRRAELRARSADADDT
ncbi:MAG TPA: AMP-binding protein [Euzebya sp.]|nr:AMP-binding protein [Euzebya sp.]